MPEDASVTKKDPKTILDSRFLKILSSKKSDLKDSLIFVYLDEDKYGHLHTVQLRKMVEQLESLAPESCWTAATKKFTVSIVDRNSVKNKDLLITIGYENPKAIDTILVEELFKQALPEAKSIKFIHQHAEVLQQ